MTLRPIEAESGEAYGAIVGPLCGTETKSKAPECNHRRHLT